MGKGGGCVPSKNRASSVTVSDRDPDHPPPEERKSAAGEISRNLRIFIVYYSMYGHVELLAKRMKKGVDSVDGVEGVLFRVPETLPLETLEQMSIWGCLKTSILPTINATTWLATLLKRSLPPISSR